MRDIVICCNCDEHFCAMCEGHAHCPDCKGAICEGCFIECDRSRQGRCIECGEEDTSVRFPYDKSTRKIYKHYSEPVRGRLG